MSICTLLLPCKLRCYTFYSIHISKAIYYCLKQLSYVRKYSSAHRLTMNSTNSTSGFNNTANELLLSKTLYAFLLKNLPEYIQIIPKHLLYQDYMSYSVQVLVATLFLIICVPTNLAHLLVFSTYSR